MKKITTISILVPLLFGGCKPTNELNGNYRNGSNIHFKLMQAPNKFEYFLKGEMGTLQYSSGMWKLEKNKLYLFGFNDDNIKTLDVESVVNKDARSNGSKIEIDYNTDNGVSYIKSLILIND